MQRKGACSNITDANFIAILQRGIGYQVYRETGGNGPCMHKYLWIHSQVEVLCPRLRLCPRDSCMCEPHCPKPQAKVFPFFFHTPNLVLTAAACWRCLPGACFSTQYTVLRPHLGLAGPAKAPSALRLMQLQTSNSYFVSPTASLEHGGGSPSPSNLAPPPLPETVTVSILLLPPSRRPRFGCPSHCQFSSLWAVCRAQQLT